jgi:glucose-6-phosphate isomerase
LTSGRTVRAPAVTLAGELAGDARRIAGELAGDVVASRIADADPSAWGPAGGAADGLGWSALPRTSRPLVGQVEALRERFRVSGAPRVLLVGDARLTLGAQALAGSTGTGPGLPLTVVDSADPGQVSDALAGDLGASVLVVADRSGADPRIEAVHRILADAMALELLDEGTDAGVAARTVVITEAGSPLDERARREGSVVVTAERDVPGPFSVLGSPGLVPAGLAGADVGAVLADAAVAAALLLPDAPDNPALELAGALVAHGDVPLVLDAASGPPGLAAWLAQLLTAAGRLPLLADELDPVDDLGAAPPGAARIALGPSSEQVDIRTTGPVGGQVLLWQYAVAAAARLLGGRPFAAEAPLIRRDPLPAEPPRATDGLVEIRAGAWLPAGTDTVGAALQALVDATPARGHVALSAWLDPATDASLAVLRGELARRAGTPAVFGWAPRDGTGGERADRVLCQLTADAPDDLVPDPGPDLTRLQLTEAGTVAADVAARGVPVLRLHLVDRVAGLVTLARAVQELRARPDGRAGREDG